MDTFDALRTAVLAIPGMSEKGGAPPHDHAFYLGGRMLFHVHGRRLLHMQIHRARANALIGAGLAETHFLCPLAQAGHIGIRLTGDGAVSLALALLGQKMAEASPYTQAPVSPLTGNDHGADLGAEMHLSATD